MSQEFQQHWLSAYLDGELSSDERALVERRLGEDPETRLLLEDLKRVRSLVATLPGWGEQAFQFDMGRLNQGELDNDDELVAIQDEQSSAARGGQSLTTAPQSSGNDAQTLGLSRSAWRGLLTLAAGLLLLILAVPFFWPRNDLSVAFTPGGGGGVGGQVDDLGSPEKNVDETFFAKNLDAPQEVNTSPMPNAAPSAVDAAKESLEVPMPKMESRGSSAPARNLSENSPSQNLQGGIGVADAPSAGRAAVDPGPRTLGAPPSSAPSVSRFSPDSSAGQRESKTNAIAPSSRFSLPGSLIAKSDDWSEVDVARALPGLPTALGQSVRRDDLDPAAKSGADTNEWLITELPKAAEVNQWFAQIQTTQPLTELFVAADLRSDNRAAGSGQQPLSRTADKAAEPADKAAEPAGDTLNSPAPTPSEPAKSLNFDSRGGVEADKANAKDNKNAPSNSRIILFVTEAQALKILATLPEKNAKQFWRVVPGDAKNHPDPSAGGDKRVILILNQLP